MIIVGYLPSGSIFNNSVKANTSTTNFSGTFTTLANTNNSINLYYASPDSNSGTLSDGDALKRIKTDGTGEETLATSVAINPADLTLDIVNGKAYLLDQAAAGKAIKAVDLSNGEVTTVKTLENTPAYAGIVVAPEQAFQFDATQSSPQDNAINVSKDTNISLKFNHKVLKGISGNFAIKDAVSGATIETISNSSSQITGWKTDTLTIDPANDLPSGKNIAIQWEKAIIQDYYSSFITVNASNSVYDFTVAGSAAQTANAANNSVSANLISVTAGGNITLTATGDRQGATGTITNDERYIPTTWSSTESGKTGNFTESSGTYTSTYTPSTAGSYTVTVTFQKQVWDGDSWENATGAGATDTKTLSVSVNSATITQIVSADIPSSNLGPFTKTISGHTFTFTPAPESTFVGFQEDIGNFGGIYMMNPAIPTGSDYGTEFTISPPAGYTFDLNAFDYISDRNADGTVELTVTLTYANNTTDSKTYTLNGNEIKHSLSSFTTQPNDVKSIKFVTNRLVYFNNFDITDIKPIPAAANSTINPVTATFDKSAQADVNVTLTLNGNTLSSIKNGTTPLVENTDYTVAGSTVTIKKEYLAGQSIGTTTLTFEFSAGNSQTLDITISDTTPLTNAEAPIINTQPSEQTVNVGSTANLTVAASVSKGNLSYQWYSNSTNNLTGGTAIDGATSATYSTPTATAGTTYYYVVVTNTDNSATGNKTATATSNLVGVTVFTYLLGDGNGDGYITPADALMAQKVETNKMNINNLTAQQKLALDVNFDHVIDTADAQLILKKYVGSIISFD
ncbi:X2-like carbohydrate binding domain-containing protein [Schinkia azotoformans]|uniref:X2-like carbohydrate binding domain-containing protein n=1 Tax=Schinkia azotoformans TaxID=1454 RepID=UPI002E21700A|nr:X2-like carbohydrate binding domain-containing protein [Schinkia azotoformans]